MKGRLSDGPDSTSTLVGNPSQQPASRRGADDPTLQDDACKAFDTRIHPNASRAPSNGIHRKYVPMFSCFQRKLFYVEILVDDNDKSVFAKLAEQYRRSLG